MVIALLLSTATVAPECGNFYPHIAGGYAKAGLSGGVAFSPDVGNANISGSVFAETGIVCESLVNCAPCRRNVFRLSAFAKGECVRFA